MKNNKGITLIELVVVLAIVGIIVNVVFSFLLFGIKSFSNQDKKNDELSSSRYALDYVTREIRKANNVEVSGSFLTIDGSVIKVIDNNLVKNNKIIVRGINTIRFIKNGDEITIRINDKYSSVIYIRKGGNHET